MTKDPTRIFFDEAGNTGENLLDESQPLYCLTSIVMSDEDAAKLLNLITSESKEKHFVALKRKPKFQAQILEILNHEVISPSTVKYCLSHKEYVLIGHLVDRFIEPVFYDYGLDLYRGGLNIMFLDGIFYCGLVRWERKLFVNFLKSLQNLIRKQTQEEVDNFYSFARRIRELYPKDHKFLDPILESKNQINSIIDGLHKNVIDMSLTSFIPLCDIWGREIGDFDVVHDDSKQMEFWREWIAYFSSQKRKEVEVGLDVRTIRYPLPIKQLILVDSTHVNQIQLADIIGSSITYAMRKIVIENNLEDDFANKIHKSKIMQISSYGLWPNKEVTKYKIDPNERNPLDHLADINRENNSELSQILDKMKRSPYQS
jgi:hypothetical protein